MNEGKDTERKDENKWADKQSCVEVKIADNPINALSCYHFGLSAARMVADPTGRRADWIALNSINKGKNLK